MFISESSTNPLKNENICSPSSQGRYEQFPYVVSKWFFKLYVDILALKKI